MEMDGGDGCTTLWIYVIHWTVHLEMVKMVHFMLCGFYHNVKNRKEKHPKKQGLQYLQQIQNHHCFTYSGSENKRQREEGRVLCWEPSQADSRAVTCQLFTVQHIFLDHTPIWGGWHAHWLGLESAQNQAATCSLKPHLCGSVWKASQASSSSMALTEAWSQLGEGPSQPLKTLEYSGLQGETRVSRCVFKTASSFTVDIPSYSCWTKSEDNQHPSPALLPPQLFSGDIVPYLAWRDSCFHPRCLQMWCSSWGLRSLSSRLSCYS